MCSFRFRTLTPDCIEMWFYTVSACLLSQRLTQNVQCVFYCIAVVSFYAFTPLCLVDATLRCELCFYFFLNKCVCTYFYVNFY